MRRIYGYKRKVIEAELNSGGQSIFVESLPLGCTWTLKLECGHQVDRNARYKFPKRRHWWKRRSPEDALPPPAFVQCHHCKWDKERIKVV